MASWDPHEESFFQSTHRDSDAVADAFETRLRRSSTLHQVAGAAVGFAAFGATTWLLCLLFGGLLLFAMCG